MVYFYEKIEGVSQYNYAKIGEKKVWKVVNYTGSYFWGHSSQNYSNWHIHSIMHVFIWGSLEFSQPLSESGSCVSSSSSAQ